MKTELTIKEKIESIKVQLAEIIDKTEQERSDNSGEDQILLQQLEDRKEYLIEQLNDLRYSLSQCATHGCKNKKYTIMMAGNKKEISIVIPHLADPSQGLISQDAPLAQALKQGEKGDMVSMTTPSGTQKIKIIDLK
jgi:transcription elongation GreA/GreB family factor